MGALLEVSVNFCCDILCHLDFAVPRVSILDQGGPILPDVRVHVILPPPHMQVSIMALSTSIVCFDPRDDPLVIPMHENPIS